VKLPFEARREGSKLLVRVIQRNCSSLATIGSEGRTNADCGEAVTWETDLLLCTGEPCPLNDNVLTGGRLPVALANESVRESRSARARKTREVAISGLCNVSEVYDCLLGGGGGATPKVFATCRASVKGSRGCVCGAGESARAGAPAVSSRDVVDKVQRSRGLCPMKYALWLRLIAPAPGELDFDAWNCAQSTELLR